MVELRRRGDWPFAAPPAAAPRHDERFNVAEARTINLTGDLTTSGILVTSAVGNNVSTITGGNLTGPTSSDLVVIQNNPSNVLTIGSTIINNTTTNLTKAGAGTLELTATNSYTGPTTVTGGVLKLTSSALGLPGGIAFAGGSSNLTLKGGVLGLMSDFSRGLGTAVDKVQFTGDGGFAAYGADRAVNFGATATWTTGSFVPIGFALLLSAPDATHTVDFQSPLSLQTGSGPQLREIRVADGAATVDAKISGIISSSFGLVKTGPGTLELSAANTYRGATQIDGGTLLLTGTIVVQSSGEGSAFYVNNGSTLKIGANGVAGGHPFFVSAGSVDFTGAFSYTAVGLTMGGGAAGTTSSVTTGATGTMAIGNDGVFYNGHFNNDNGATISGNLALTSATDAAVRNRTFTVGNSVNATNDLSISAVISNGGTGQSNGLTKLGPGTLNLSGTSTYTGLTTVSAGTLAYGVSDALSSGAVTVAR